MCSADLWGFIKKVHLWNFPPTIGITSTKNKGKVRDSILQAETVHFQNFQLSNWTRIFLRVAGIHRQLIFHYFCSRKKNMEKAARLLGLRIDGQYKHKYLFPFYNHAVQNHNIKMKDTFLENTHIRNEGDFIDSVINV